MSRHLTAEPTVGTLQRLQVLPCVICALLESQASVRVLETIPVYKQLSDREFLQPGKKALESLTRGLQYPGILRLTSTIHPGCEFQEQGHSSGLPGTQG